MLRGCRSDASRRPKVWHADDALLPGADSAFATGEALDVNGGVPMELTAG